MLLEACSQWIILDARPSVRLLKVVNPTVQLRDPWWRKTWAAMPEAARAVNVTVRAT